MADRDRRNPGKTTPEEDEDFVNRWSRRKHEAARGRAPARPEGNAPAPVEDAADTGPTDADLPAPESLGPDSDYSAFLSKRVSEGLRRAALRKLFHQPQFNVRDGLDDYDEDYRSFASLGDTITADMRYHRERLRRQAQQAEDDERSPAPAESADGEADVEPPPEPDTPPDDLARNDNRDDDGDRDDEDDEHA
ncbi:MAG: DUF3306 domain-containing protein [Halofilum sp. (in: g-proteobacteria)]|nr:DUF3306 domain-containing protein [Halofilum sp. (in: g-proteobacteria)]